MSRKSHRQGYTIVEIISLMAVVSLLLMASSRVLQLSYKSHREALGYLTDIETLNQITHRIRNDVDSATEFSSGDEIELTSATRRVRYVQDSGFLVRSWGSSTTANDETATRADSDFTGQQRWRLPDGAKVAWEIDSAQEHPLLHCGLQFPNSQRVGFTWQFLLRNIAPASKPEQNNSEPQGQKPEEQASE